MPKQLDKIFKWTPEAEERLERVPEGFMRAMTKSRVEQYAEEINAAEITFEIAEQGISGAKDTMTSMMGSGMSSMMSAGADSKAMAEKELEISDNSKDFQIDENVDYYFCDTCGYTVKGYKPDECPICRAEKEKFKLVENKKELVTPSSGRLLDWTTQGIERLSKIPEGFMRDMTKWRIEAFVRKSGSLKVTEDLIEQKYQYWGEGSKNVEKELSWNEEAKEKIQKIPDFIRGMVIKEVENEAKKKGCVEVTADTLSNVRAKWSNTMEFHSEFQKE